MFKLIFVIDGWGISCEIALSVTQLYIWYKVNISLGIALVQQDNKELPKPMLTQFYVVIWHH